MASTGGVKGSSTNNNVSYTALAAIDAGYIVIQDTSDADQVEVAGAGTDKLFGVTVSDASDAGYPVTVRTDGYVRVLAGTGGFARGEYVTSDATGTGVDTTNAADIVIGIAEESPAAGEYGMVKLINPVRYDSL